MLHIYIYMYILNPKPNARNPSVKACQMLCTTAGLDEMTVEAWLIDLAKDTSSLRIQDLERSRREEVQKKMIKDGAAA